MDINIFEDFVKSLAKNNSLCFPGIPPIAKWNKCVPTTYYLGFLQKRTWMNWWKSRLKVWVVIFERELWTWKVDSAASSVLWSQGLSLQKSGLTRSDQAIPLSVHPGENIVTGEFW